MSVLKPLHPGARILDGVLVPVEGDHLTEAATMSLSTPIVSAQDGPRMSGTFGGKKAAPFVKGGGRSKTHPNDAQGRKRKAAKAAIAKARAARGGDYSNLDLAFDPKEPRDNDGRWIRAAERAKMSGKLHAMRAVRRDAFVEYDVKHTLSNKAHNTILNILDDGEKAAKAQRRAATKRFLRDMGKTMDAMNKSDMLSMSNADTDLAFNPREPRGKDGKWVGYGRPHEYVPEMGARGPAEFKYLQAKNSLAKAVLAKDDKAIKKAQKKVGESHIQFLQEKRASEAIVASAKPSSGVNTTASALEVSNGLVNWHKAGLRGFLGKMAGQAGQLPNGDFIDPKTYGR